MTRYLVLLVVCQIGLFASPTRSLAQTVDGDMLAADSMDRCGLERAWFTQVQVDPSRGRVIDLQLHISAVESLTVFEVVSLDGGKWIFSERDLDNFGDEVGRAGAQKRATNHAEAVRAGGGDAEVVQREVPESTLYATTDLGVLHAIDARTGATRWASAFGRSQFPTARPAVHENYVAVVNGTELYMVDAATGQLLWNQKCRSLPMVAGTFSEDTLFVPLLNGQIHAYAVERYAPKWPEVYYARRTVHYPPTVVGKNVIWTSDAGDISVGTVGVSGIRYRLMIDSAPAGQVAAQPPRTMYAASQSGVIYSFDLARGDLRWERSTGQEITVGPVMVGETVYVATKRDGMYALDADTGEVRWLAPDVKQFVVVAGDLVYGLTEDRRLLAIDVERGLLRANAFLGSSDLAMVNPKTDWSYVATRRGLVYCMRPQGADWPVIHQPPPVTAPAEPDEELPGAEQTQPETDGDAPIDPFGEAADPFADELGMDTGAGAARGLEPPDDLDPFN